jgi:predicted phage tail protein
MRKKVNLLGILGVKFGAEHHIAEDTANGIFKCLCANNPKFRNFLIENQHLDFFVRSGDTEIGDINEGITSEEVFIGIAPEGSKSGGSKLLAAVLIVAAFYIPGASAYLGTFSSLTTAGQLAVGLAVNLALTGIQQIMAPDPATDSDAPESYLFNGAEQNVIEGDPIPLLYGELMVPGTPISFELINRQYYKNNTYTDNQGNIIWAA